MIEQGGGIYGVYLAAGGSRRMGRPKLELAYQGRALGVRALDAACRSGLDGVLVVTRETEAPTWLEPIFAQDPAAAKVRLVHCPDALLGQAYSLRSGVRAAIGLGAAAVVVLLADQPLLQAEVIDRLLGVYRAHRSAGEQLNYAAACCGGLPKPPVLFDAEMFPQLLQLSGDEGARRLLRELPPHTGIRVEFADGRLFADIDTWEDYAALLKDL